MTTVLPYKECRQWRWWQFYEVTCIFFLVKMYTYFGSPLMRFYNLNSNYCPFSSEKNILFSCCPVLLFFRVGNFILVVFLENKSIKVSQFFWSFIFQQVCYMGHPLSGKNLVMWWFGCFNGVVTRIFYIFVVCTPVP